MIKLRIQIENLKVESAKENANKCDVDKDELIKKLQNEIKHERQIGAHIQFTQEREIIEKEREIASLKDSISGMILNKPKNYSTIKDFNGEDSDSDTSTFHDALSDGDENEVLLEDLEYD